MQLWVDDVRPVPDNFVFPYARCKSVNYAKHCIEQFEKYVSLLKYELDNRDMMRYKVDPEKCKAEIEQYTITLIDIDHDAGDYADDGGDYIKLLDWLEETGRNYPIRIHSMNPVGVANMRRIIERNGWTEVM